MCSLWYHIYKDTGASTAASLMFRGITSTAESVEACRLNAEALS